MMPNKSLLLNNDLFGIRTVLRERFGLIEKKQQLDVFQIMRLNMYQ